MSYLTFQSTFTSQTKFGWLQHLKIDTVIGMTIYNEMVDHDTEAMRAHWADRLFRWKMKNSQQISHMTGSYCWVRSMLW